MVADPVAEGMNNSDGVGGPGAGELGVLGVGFGAALGEGVVQRFAPQHLVVAVDPSGWLAALTTGVEKPDPEAEHQLGDHPTRGLRLSAFVQSPPGDGDAGLGAVVESDLGTGVPVFAVGVAQCGVHRVAQGDLDDRDVGEERGREVSVPDVEIEDVGAGGVGGLVVGAEPVEGDRSPQRLGLLGAFGGRHWTPSRMAGTLVYGFPGTASLDLSHGRGRGYFLPVAGEWDDTSPSAVAADVIGPARRRRGRPGRRRAPAGSSRGLGRSWPWGRRPRPGGWPR